MDPKVLIELHSTTPLPAPFWFIEAMKVLGFVLHMVPMNLWYAGLLLSLHLRRDEHGPRFAGRLAGQMPVIVALGINFGIVPLLFLQVAYNKLFYPATILMAWPWLAMIAMLIPAYYGVYLYAFGVKGGGAPAPWRRAAGWIASGLFIIIGFLFANAMSLTGHVDRWPALYRDHQVAGAATGTALNWGDPTLWPRWLLVFGLALGTTAVWALFDAAWLARREGPEYRAWAQRFALRIYAIGTVWFAVCGSWYAFGTWRPEVRQLMFSWPTIALTMLTAMAPGLPLAWLFLRRQSVMGRGEVALLATAHLGVLSFNAVSRQIVQNVELKRLIDVAAQPAEPQWGPMLVFLALCAVGLSAVGWMVAQIVRADWRQAAP